MSQRDSGRTSSRIRREADELETLLDGVGETAPQPSTRYLSELDPKDERETIVAVMSGVDRKGAWEPAAKISRFWQLHETRLASPMVLVASGVL